MLVDMSQVVDAFKIPLKGVFHVGAHYGQEIDIYEKLGIKDVIMFEPSKKNFEVLEQRVGSKATLVNLGLGSKHEFLELNVEENNQGMSNSVLTPKIHKEQYPHIKFTSNEKIELTTLDDWVVENLTRSSHNILVMDVQGFEFDVLQGSVKTLKNIDVIITEVNRAELYENCAFITDIDVFLRFYGFRRVVTNWEGRTWGDAIYVRESLITAAGFSSQVIFLLDKRFQHSKDVLGFDSLCLTPTARFDWERRKSNFDSNDTVVITDDLIQENADLNCNKIAFLVEPSSIDKQPYINAFNCQDKYNVMISHDREFVRAVKNGRHAPFGGTWIKPEDWRFFDKTKMVSLIASNKKITRGHNLRHQVASLIDENDRFGSAFKHIEYKLEGLKDYMFSVVIENEKISGYFTEKIVDAMITGTVPIYWGCDDIGDFFEKTGIITFDTIEELSGILNDKEKLMRFYNDNKDAIKRNCIKARRYSSVDENFLNAIVGVQ